MALHPAPGCFPSLLRHFRCMQGELLAAAARTGNSDEPLPLTLLPVPCSRAHTTFITTQRWRLVHISPHSVCRLVISPVRATPSPLTHSPTRPPPAAGSLSCRLAVQPCSAAAAGCWPRRLRRRRRRPQTLPVSSPLAHARGCAWVPRHHTNAPLSQRRPARSRPSLLLLSSVSRPPPHPPPSPSLLLACHSSACLLPFAPPPPFAHHLPTAATAHSRRRM